MRKTAIFLMVLGLALFPLACSSGDDAAETTDEAAAIEETSGAAESAAQGGGGDAAVVSSSLPAVGPRIIQTASIRMSVPRDGFEDALDRARTVATGFGGFVVSSSAAKGSRGGPERGSVVLRVPNRSYGRAMSELAGIGRIESRREGGEDVSQEFVDLEARARHLRAVEVQLLELLDRARTVPAALAVQSHLNTIQLELEQVRGRLRFLEDQTSYATISLSIRERGAVAAAEDGGWGVVEAWRDGAEAFVKVAGRAFVVLAAAAPLLLLAALGLFGLRAARRRSLFGWGSSQP